MMFIKTAKIHRPARVCDISCR